MSEQKVHGYHMVILTEHDRDSPPAQDYKTLYFPSKELAERFINKQ